MLPVIKNIWTSSFVLVSGGWCLLLLAAFHALVDVLGWQRHAFFFFTVIGANAITIYFLQRCVDFGKTADFFCGGLASLAGSWQPVVAALGVLAVKWLLLVFLWRHRVFLRV